MRNKVLVNLINLVKSKKKKIFWQTFFFSGETHVIHHLIFRLVSEKLDSAYVCGSSYV